MAPLDSLARVLGKLARPGSLALLHHTRVPLLRLTDNKVGNCAALCNTASLLPDRHPGGPELQQPLRTAGGAANQVLCPTRWPALLHCNVRIFKRRFPSLPPLLTFLKRFLAVRGLSQVQSRLANQAKTHAIGKEYTVLNLCQVFTGGLGSHALTLLIVSFLQLHPRPRPDTANLGVLLMEFLDLYGRRYEPGELKTSLTCRLVWWSDSTTARCASAWRRADATSPWPTSTGQTCQPLSLYRCQWARLAGLHCHIDCVVQDPLNPSNNITSGSFRMWEVVRAWAWAYQLLCRAVRRAGSGTSFLQPLITGGNQSFT